MNSSSVGEFIRREVPDWDDEVVATARFKAFSGQRSDWEPKFLFWRDLILKVAKHFGVFITQSSQVKNSWFMRGGLTPLCIDHVLFEMYNSGDILLSRDLVDPTMGRMSQLIKKMKNLMGVSGYSAPQDVLEDRLFLKIVLQACITLAERADEVVKLLSENHWTSFCIITMRNFQRICKGTNEASVILSYLSGIGKARFLSVNKTDIIEGVKVSLGSATVSSISSLDADNLHLIWTAEKLQQQLDVIDQRYETSKKHALASIKAGKKQIAVRYARQLKLASESREKCTTLLNRVEEVLSVIANAESTKKVSEAIQIGARAIKESAISAEEVETCLQELDECVTSQKEVEQVLESTPLQYTGIEDEDVEEEFKKLELGLGDEIPQMKIPQTDGDGSSRPDKIQQSPESPNIKIAEPASVETERLESIDSLSNKLSKVRLEAA
ncbi:hypothetical protein GIB67_029876 [Kingdonia uniflora]|uniref:Charged multivesicular body protein 7 n=1 Tax=Kingdonia uniflora TaxID=39325 RepID=A0A7J7NK08_9MAGN|nr:hypothetical protein GIB67_029876 [Kingdonia uniflora]